MFASFKQFVPSPVCLACEGCCRFREENSCWRPKITDAEKVTVARPGKPEKVFPSESVGPDNALRTVPWQGTHLCTFFHPDHNTCGIYPHRPFECQLYPFVVIKVQDRLSLAVHLACPHVQENRYDPEFGHALEELKVFFNQKATRRFLEQYRGLDHSYAGFNAELETLFSLEPFLEA